MGINLQDEDMDQAEFENQFIDESIFVDFYECNRQECDNLNSTEYREIAELLTLNEKNIQYQSQAQLYFFDELIEFVKRLCVETFLPYKPLYIMSAIHMITRLIIFEISDN